MHKYPLFRDKLTQDHDTAFFSLYKQNNFIYCHPWYHGTWGSIRYVPSLIHQQQTPKQLARTRPPSFASLFWYFPPSLHPAPEFSLPYYPANHLPPGLLCYVYHEIAPLESPSDLPSAVATHRTICAACSHSSLRNTNT